ncbi:hypothetical protein EYF80_067866 [Liparis tanakae]|uniref:Uncharacterized protein n=1 Tax=Liparis tanakae TaxID=230148 RepID=A0A4Z2DZN9_9TELE|nr:hypothetical protein EYF80_067866 [Liparis tanakae]
MLAQMGQQAPGERSEVRGQRSEAL